MPDDPDEANSDQEENQAESGASTISKTEDYVERTATGGTAISWLTNGNIAIDFFSYDSEVGLNEENELVGLRGSAKSTARIWMTPQVAEGLMTSIGEELDRLDYEFEIPTQEEE